MSRLPFRLPTPGVLVLALILAGPAVAQEGNTPRTDAAVAKIAKVSEATVRRYLAAVAAHDLATVDAMAEPAMAMRGARVDCLQRGGAACFKRLSRREIADGAKLDLQKLTVERDLVRANLSIDSAAIRARAGGPILVTDEFVVDGDRLSSFVRTLRTEDPATHRYAGTLKADE